MPFQLVEQLLRKAADAGATSLLLVPDNPPVIRVNGELQPPIAEMRFNFYQTQDIARELLSEPMWNQLDVDGSAEVPFLLGGVSGRAVVFYGLGSHHVIFHLDKEGATSRE